MHSGFKINPAQVEAVLDQHPEVVRSAVVLRPLAGQEAAIALVQLLPGSVIRAAVLAKHVRDQLTGQEAPSEIIIVDVLPPGAVDKMHTLLDEIRRR